MNQKQTPYLRTVAECGCMTTAARKLYISQPSLSQTPKPVEPEHQITELQQERFGRLWLGISVTRALQILPQVLPVFRKQYRFLEH